VRSVLRSADAADQLPPMAQFCRTLQIPALVEHDKLPRYKATATFNSDPAPVCPQHELSHFLAFKKPLYNKVLSIFSNMVLVVPTATTFRKYHQEHHSHLVRHLLIQHISMTPRVLIQAHTCTRSSGARHGFLLIEHQGGALSPHGCS